MTNNETLLEERIVSVVTEAYEIPLEDIIRQVRKKEIVEPRQVIAYCLRLMTDLSFPAIGALLGGRDHTTIMHACSKIAEKIEQKEKFRARIEAILDKIRNIEAAAEEEQLLPEEATPEVLATTEEVEQFKTHYNIPTTRLDLSPREKDILKEYRGGMTLEEIGKEWGVSRERIRQIASKATLKVVGAKIKEGFEIDVDEFLKGEKLAHDLSKQSVPAEDRQRLLRDYMPRATVYVSLAAFAKDVGISLSKLKFSFPEIVEIIEQKIKEKNGRWSRYYPKCRGCGTTTIPHIRKGYCQKCFGVYRGNRRENLLGNNALCAVCSIDRKSAIGKYGRDMFITRDNRVLCRGCFLQLTGSKLAESRNHRI